MTVYMHFKAYRIKVKYQSSKSYYHGTVNANKSVWDRYPHQALNSVKWLEKYSATSSDPCKVYVEEFELHLSKTYDSSGKEVPNGI